MSSVNRREALGWLAGTPFLGGLIASAGAGAEDPRFRLATFEVDVTVPLGHPLMGGGIAPARTVVDPLLLRGVVLTGGEAPVVLAAIDWCEVRNEAYQRWREVIAQAVGTVPGRVLFTSVHQHDAPVADLQAQRILDRHGCAGRITDLAFHEQTLQKAGAVVREAMTAAGPVTHFGVGSAPVEQVASNRRYPGVDGKPRFDRTSSTRDAYARSQPEGTIDPLLRTLSFWNNDRPVAALNVYATHPMSYYGQGGVSADFVGQARRRRQEEMPGVFQMYVSGCSGNVTAGKYNDGSPENRGVLAGRIASAMSSAWEATVRHPLERVGFRSVPLVLEPRRSAGFTTEDLTERLREGNRPFDQCLAAMGLSWRERSARGEPIDVPVLDLGAALWVVLPGESYVEYQLHAQELRPDAFVLTAGYGECATGYVPTEKAIAEGDTNLGDWCWVAPGAEERMKGALREVLKPGR